MSLRFVIVGGGIAGLTCAEELCRLRKKDVVTLVTVDAVLKGVETIKKHTNIVEELKVVEKRPDTLPFANLHLIQGVAIRLDIETKVLLLQDGSKITYDKLCICTGARPRRLLNSPYVLVLRDTDSVGTLASQMLDARRVIIVGNGGIALELAHALRGVDVTWVVREGHIGDAFFDKDAAQFLLQQLRNRNLLIQMDNSMAEQAQTSKLCTDAACAGAVPPTASTQTTMGHAVGPDWTSALQLGAEHGSLSVELNSNVVSIERQPSAGSDDNCPVIVKLSNGRSLSANIVISAIGVDPAVDWVPLELQRGAGGGLAVDHNMQTSVPGIFAAGDACTVTRKGNTHWFQMRTWNQAKSQGMYVAHCMCEASDIRGSDMAFELFTHVTRFLGLKVVLLGLYNGQGLDAEPQDDMVSYSRIMKAPGPTFVRVLVLRGRVQGAVLLGETDLEETMENLILDGLDVGSFGPELLDPDIELDHMFD